MSDFQPPDDQTTDFVDYISEISIPTGMENHVIGFQRPETPQDFVNKHKERLEEEEKARQEWEERMKKDPDLHPWLSDPKPSLSEHYRVHACQTINEFRLLPVEDRKGKLRFLGSPGGYRSMDLYSDEVDGKLYVLHSSQGKFKIIEYFENSSVAYW
jgi:hypothetical protein